MKFLHTFLAALLLFAFGAFAASYDIKVKYAPPLELDTYIFDPGELVANQDDWSDLRVGDGETPGGLHVGQWLAEALRNKDFLHGMGGATAEEIRAFVAFCIADQIAAAPTQEWVFTLSNGAVVTNRVLVPRGR